MAEPFKIRNPNFAARLADSFARQDIISFLDAKISTIDPGSFEISVPYRRELTQQRGFFHGGVIGTFITLENASEKPNGL